MSRPTDDFTLLCVRILSGEGSAAERRRLAALLRDPDRRARYEELQSRWRACPAPPAPDFDAPAAYRRFEAGLARTGRAPAGHGARIIRLPVPRRLALLWLAAAAALAIALGASLRLTPANAPAVAATPWIERTARAGEKSTVRLPDGTRVTLNGDSALSYPATFGATRRARLVGEAYFEVAHDPAHPFVLVAGGLQTRVLGTKFDVRALRGDGRTSVALVEGRVEVRPLRAAPTTDPVLLRPGQQYALDRTSRAGRVGAFDPDVALDWMNGALVFRDEPLATVAARLEQRFGIRFEIVDPAVAGKTLDARFRRESLSEILQAVSFACGVRCTVLPDSGAGTRIRLEPQPRADARSGPPDAAAAQRP